MGVTDGSLTRITSEMDVNVTGGSITTTPSGTQTVSGTVTSNAGTGPAAASGWFVRITDGTDTAFVTGLNQLIVTTGQENAGTTFTAASGAANGTTVNFGSSLSNITMVITAGAGVSAGVVALEVTQDGTNWYRHTTTVTLTAPGVSQITMTGFAFRQARGVITTAITGGTIGATIMAS